MRIAIHRDNRLQERHGTRGMPIVPPRLLCLALAIALVSTIISLSAKAAGAIAAASPDTAYRSAEDAFTAVFLDSGLGQRAFRENREYAAAIYQLADGGWHCTLPVAGTRDESAIPYHAVPADAVRIVGAHTHGQPFVAGDSGHVYGVDFSRADLRNAVHNYRITHGRIAAQLLLSSEFKVLRFTLDGDPRSAHDDDAERSVYADPGIVIGALRGTTETLAVPEPQKNPENPSGLAARRSAQEILVGRGQALAQAGLRDPSQIMQP
jgi:hypothetical protein